MKKIILLLLIMVGFFITASAQTNVNRQRTINERKRDRMESRRIHRIRRGHHRRRHHRFAVSDLNGQYKLTLNLFKPEESSAG